MQSIGNNNNNNNGHAVTMHSEIVFKWFLTGFTDEHVFFS